MYKYLILIAFVLAPTTLSCEDSSASAEQSDASSQEVFRLPVTITSKNGSKTFQAEVVDTPSSRAQGLMFRERMEPDHGMLFLFPKPGELSFWMKNTKIALDMVFISPDRVVTGVVHNAEPETTVARRVDGISQFVLEVNAGIARKYSISKGDRVSFMAPIPSS